MNENLEDVSSLGDFLDGIIVGIIENENLKEYSKIIEYAISPGENFIGILRRINIIGVDREGKSVKLSLILKIPPTSAIMREQFPIGPVYVKEVFVYNEILPALCALEEKYNIPQSERLRQVRCYKADSTQYKEFLVLEDMCKQGFQVINKKEPLKLEYLKLVLKRMANYHALSFVFQQTYPERFLEFANNTGGLKNMDNFEQFIEAGKQRALTVIKDEHILERVTNFTADYMQQIKTYVDPNYTDPYTVLCHGDFWINNLLFEFQIGEPVDVCILDWQFCRLSSPITDLVYLIFTSTDYALRNRHFDEMIQHYYYCLDKSLRYMDCEVEHCFPKEIFSKHVKKILPFGLYVSFMTLPYILGAAEAVTDMNDIESSVVNYTSNDASRLYSIRMNEVIQTLVDMNVI